MRRSTSDGNRSWGEPSSYEKRRMTKGIRAQPAGKSRSFRSLFLMPRRRRSGHATNAVSGGLPDVLASLECQFETSGLLAADSVAARIPNPLSGRTNHQSSLTNLRLDIFHYGNT